MTERQSRPEFAEWSLRSAAEPTIRIGVVLAEDADEILHLEVVGAACAANFDDRARGLSAGDDAATDAVPPGTAVQVRRSDGRLAVRVGEGTAERCDVLRLASRAADSPDGGAGVLARDVVAGRGFHWQKWIDCLLPGVVEVRAADGGLVLVNELPLEAYLAGVITAEMSGACPAALLEAQCIVARAWILARTEPKHLDEPFDRCNDDCCQRYQGVGALSETAAAAARATRGRLLIDPTGGVLDANYSKSCGGVSELPEHVWGAAKPGLSAVVDAPPDAAERRFLPVTEENLDAYLDGEWLATTRVYCSPNVVPVDAIGAYLGRVDEVAEYFRWTVTLERGELEAHLRRHIPEAAEMRELRDLRVTARGVSGRASRLAVDWIGADGAARQSELGSEYDIRAALHEKFLFSSAFAIRPQRDADGRLTTVTLRGAGWGHGAGLCQIGALGMALCGIDGESICLHYYPQSRLETVYA